MVADFSPIGLRVLREVAQAGSFSAAARTLGYTQSAVSRQAAALEAVAGRRLFDRGRHGVILTPAGSRLLPRASRVLDELDAALREAADEQLAVGPVRLVVRPANSLFRGGGPALDLEVLADGSARMEASDGCGQADRAVGAGARASAAGRERREF
ncbi:MAG: LysR family transcriptional regulator [Solirubrobacteraceae bacterium]